VRVKFQITAAAYEIIVPDTLCDFGVVFDRESFSAKHIEQPVKRSKMRIFEPPGISALRRLYGIVPVINSSVVDLITIFIHFPFFLFAYFQLHFHYSVFNVRLFPKSAARLQSVSWAVFLTSGP
jgi:hypothetical protein